jgi:hypothetical protein
MSDVLRSEPDLGRWEPKSVPHSRMTRAWYRSANMTALARLPTVQPGQLWLVQFPSTHPEFSPLEYQTLTTANVVIYDRALTPIVANSLPLGGYAELATPEDAAAERCVPFTRDGWSVARLVDQRSGWVDGLRQLSERLLRASAVSSALAIINDGGHYTKIEVELAELGDAVERLGFGQSVTMTIILDGIEAGTAPHCAVASANGLAG